MHPTANTSSFWKRSSFSIPGFARKREEPKRKMQSCPSAFSIYQNSVRDAWGIYLDNSRENLLRAHATAKNCSGDTQARQKTSFKKCKNIEDLRKYSWNGIPNDIRPTTWKMLCDYIPFDNTNKEEILKTKRSKYWNLVEKHFEESNAALHKDTFHQIHIDVPRMNPFVDVFQKKIVQDMFERILFVWALEHPASGYVQGMNDLVTPFFLVFSQQYIGGSKNYWNVYLDKLCKEELNALEADVFWCLDKFLTGLVNNYTEHQCGIQINIKKMRNLVQRIDKVLYDHLVFNEVDFVQFAFR